MSLPTDLRIKITSADGSIDRLVPQSKLFTPSWSIERYGGYGEFSLPTGLDYRTFTRVQQGDMVEVYFQGVRKYRGYVTERKRSNDNPRKLSLSAYGAAFWLRKVPVSKTYAFPAGATDVSVAFAQFCNDFLLGNVGPGGIQLAYSVQAETIGTTILNLDARYKSAGDVLDAIIGETGNLAVWGVDVDSEGYNRIYLRPFSDTTPPNNPDFVIFAPGINVEASEGPETIADVVNAVIVQGGAAKFPQLLHNGNFELPVYQNDGAGNMVLNGGFESGGFHVADDWTLANGASVESGKNQSPARAVAFEGSRYLELDHVSENAVQNGTGTWAAGHNYVFSCQMAKEVDQQSLSGHARLIIKDGTSAVVFDSGSVTMQPPGQDWEYFSIPFTFPTSGFTAGSGTFQITFNLDSITAFGGQQGGLIIDAVELQDVSVVYQDGWEIQATGDAVINSVNWVCQESYEGAYSLYVDGSTFADADARDVEIIPASGQVSNNYQNTNKVKVQTGQSLRFAGWFKSPSFPSIHPNFPALLLIFDWLDSSSNFLSQSRNEIAAPGGQITQWTYYELNATAPTNAVYCLPRAILRSTGSILMDALSIRDSQAPPMALLTTSVTNTNGTGTVASLIVYNMYQYTVFTTTTALSVGDTVLFTSGAASGKTGVVVNAPLVSGSYHVYINQKLTTGPSAGDSFSYTRNTGGTTTSATSGSTTAIGNYLPEGNLQFIISCDDPYLAQVWWPSQGNPSSAPPSTSTVSAPTTAVTLSAATPTSPTNLAAGTYTVGYTVTIGGIESTVGGTASITITEGQEILATVSSLPGGTTLVKYYVNPAYVPIGASSASKPYYFAAVAANGSQVTITTFLSVPSYFFSQMLYGVQCDTVSDTNIIDLTGAMSVADAVFRAKSQPVYRPTATLDGDTRAFWPGNSVSLQGTDGPSISGAMLPIVRIRQTHDGILKTTLELEREQPDISITLKKLFLQLLRSQGVAAGGASFGSAGSYNNPSNGGGGGSSSGNGIVVTDGTNTVNGTTKIKFLTGTVSNPSTGEADYTITLPNFADDENLDSAIGTSGFTLAHTPNPVGSLRLVAYDANGSGTELLKDVAYTLTGVAGTFVTSLDATDVKKLRAWYRY
jgi:hypothetical protein